MNPMALGVYTLAEQIVEAIMQLLITASSQVALPMFSRLQSDLKRFRRAFYQATRFTSCLALPTFLGLAATASVDPHGHDLKSYNGSPGDGLTSCRIDTAHAPKRIAKR